MFNLPLRRDIVHRVYEWRKVLFKKTTHIARTKGTVKLFFFFFSKKYKKKTHYLILFSYYRQEAQAKSPSNKKVLEEQDKVINVLQEDIKEERLSDQNLVLTNTKFLKRLDY